MRHCDWDPLIATAVVRRDASGRDVQGVSKRSVYRPGRDSGPTMSRRAAGVISEGVCVRTRGRLHVVWAALLCRKGTVNGGCA